MTIIASVQEQERPKRPGVFVAIGRYEEADKDFCSSCGCATKEEAIASARELGVEPEAVAYIPGQDESSAMAAVVEKSRQMLSQCNAFYSELPLAVKILVGELDTALKGLPCP